LNKPGTFFYKNADDLAGFAANYSSRRRKPGNIMYLIINPNSVRKHFFVTGSKLLFRKDSTVCLFAKRSVQQKAGSYIITSGRYFILQHGTNLRHSLRHKVGISSPVYHT